MSRRQLLNVVLVQPLINTIVDKKFPYLVDTPQHKGFIQCDSNGPKCQVPIKSRKNNGPQLPLLIKLHDVPKSLLVHFDHIIPKGAQGHGRKKGRMHVHVLGIEDKKQFITLMSYIASRLMFLFKVIFLAKQSYLYHLATMVESYIFYGMDFEIFLQPSYEPSKMQRFLK